jgi:DNA-binding transcriptional LysR family regulator
MRADLTRLTLRQLRYFEAVARLGGFRQAADRLHMSQPPLTQAIKILEGTLGVALFERHGRGVRPTAAAEELLIGVGHVFEVLGEAVDRTHAAAGQVQGRLGVGMTDDFTFSPVLGRLLHRDGAPGGLAIDTSHGLSTHLISQLLDGAIDIALTLEFPGPPPRGVVAAPLTPVRIMLLAPADHPLASLEAVKPHQLANEPMILMPEGSRSPFARQCVALFRGPPACGRGSRTRSPMAR